MTSHLDLVKAALTISVGGGGTLNVLDAVAERMGAVVWLSDLDVPGPLYLLGIRERMGAVGGRLDVVSAPGEGTTLRYSVPRPWLVAGASANLGADRRRGAATFADLFGPFPLLDEKKP